MRAREQGSYCLLEMKLDANALRYLTKSHFRVLTAIEMGMRNHELVPIELVRSIAKVRSGGVHKLMGDLFATPWCTVIEASMKDTASLT